jgi:nicotinate-nucleotide adenylyltransferase
VKRLGIFGGSFNPVHIGHCAVAEHFVQHVKLDRCVFVPTFISPFKSDEPVVTDPYRRLAMLRSVCRTNARFAVSDVELRRKDISYTIHTLRHFRAQHPDAQLFLLVGRDLLARFDEWRQWEEIVRMATVCVAGRPFASAEGSDDNRMLQRIAETGNAPIELTPPRIELSSSMIRTMCAAGESIRYVVPDSVRRIIRRHGLYTSHQAQAGTANTSKSTNT